MKEFQTNDQNDAKIKKEASRQARKEARQAKKEQKASAKQARKLGRQQKKLFRPISRTLEIPVTTSRFRLLATLILVVVMAVMMSVFGQFGDQQIPMKYWGAMVVMLILTLIFGVFHFDFKGKARNVWWVLLLFGSIVLIQCMVQAACGMPMFTGSRFDKFGLVGLLLAWLIIASAIFLFYAITGRLRLALRIVSIALLVLGIVNYFLLLYRGDPFYWGDLMTANTGMDVIGGYRIYVSGQMIAAFYCMVPLYFIGRQLPNKITDDKRENAKLRIGGVAFMLVFAFVFLHVPVEDVFDSWAPKNNQYVMAFATNAKLLRVKKPSGYSVAGVKKIVNSGAKKAKKEVDANTTAGKKATEAVAKGKKPTVIAIMNESFSDLSEVGDFKTNKDYMPFFHSLKKNATKGYLYVDVFGAGTCNTEYSFLTGNSTAFLPQNTRAYQMYTDYTTPSLAKNLKAQGYDTYAMHPGRSNAWKRNKVYPYLGFDKTYFYEDSFANAPLTRNEYVSDRATYNKIKEIYNSRGSKPQFIFDVTIANHGGYTTGATTGMDQIKITGMPNKVSDTTDYSSAEEYLTLIKESDTALKELVDYFKQQDQPVAIVFFGDHQPRLPNSFFSDLKGKDIDDWTNAEVQTQYVTPYMIWTNYDNKTAQNQNLSVNYLQTELLQTLGLKTTPYDRYEWNMHSSMPVINNKGILKKNGQYMTLEDAENSDKTVQDYQKVLYNNMFDEDENRVRSLFLHKNAVDGKTDAQLHKYLEEYSKKYQNETMNVVN